MNDHTAPPTRRRLLGWIGAGLAALALPRPLWSIENPQASYRETIAVLTMLYHGEIESFRRYKAYERQALQEGLVNITHLFAATADSEAVHARRFREILEKLGAAPAPLSDAPIRVGSNKENLKYATDVELAEIDIHYPEYLSCIRGEGHARAFKFITYAWKSEQQHRELIKDIRSGTGIFFSMLLKRFRDTSVRYFVCQNCGSTLTAMPTGRCPICAFPISWCKEIPLPSLHD